MFPPGLLLLLMAGSAPAPAVSLSIKPPQPKSPSFLTGSRCLIAAKFPFVLRRWGRNILLTLPFPWEKRKSPEFACLPLKSVPLSEAHSPKASIQPEKLLARHTQPMQLPEITLR